MYKPEKENKHYFLVICAVASLVGWAFFTYYRPIVVESSCSDIAATSSNLYLRKRDKLDPYFTYENVKARCLEETKYEHTTPIYWPGNASE